MPAEIRYVSKVGKDAWLRVKLDDGSEVSLPQFLKVNFKGTSGGRDAFEILEGPNKGKSASVARKSTSESYLVPGIHQLPAGLIRFNLARQSLTYGSSGPVMAFSGAFDIYTQVPKGRYLLAIPDAPHSATRAGYYAFTDYHKTWFRIGISTSGSRYLHVGEISEGCVTVRAFVPDATGPARPGFDDLPGLQKSTPGALGFPLPAKLPPVGSWDAIYMYLINRRQDDQSVGSLIVE